MRIFVCIKQVPATNKVQVDEKTGVLKRAGVQSKMNPYDLYALETALRLREAHGGTVTVGTMGPPQAQAIIREAYMMGADEGYVFSDRRLGGADVLATSYTLSQAIRSVGDFDLILCGRQTTDGDTAQVGPAIAEHLGIPHAAWVSKLTVSGDGVDAEQQLQDVVETVHIPFPCLVTVEQDIYMPRLPSLKTARQRRGARGLDGRRLRRTAPRSAEKVEIYLKEVRRHGKNRGIGTQVHRLRPLREELSLRGDRHEGGQARAERGLQGVRHLREGLPGEGHRQAGNQGGQGR